MFHTLAADGKVYASKPSDIVRSPHRRKTKIIQTANQGIEVNNLWRGPESKSVGEIYEYLFVSRNVAKSAWQLTFTW